MKGKNKLVLRILTVFLILMVFSSSVFIPNTSAATANSTSSLKATTAYTLKNLKYGKAVQNFYIGSKYIYITQRINSTTYLSRLKIEGNKAYYKDHMTLLNAGHGQTLDYYTYNGEGYFYIGCKAESSNMAFSLQIARIKYEAGKTYDYTDLNRFTYMNYASKSKKSLGTTYRVACGTTSTYTIFRIQTKEKSVTYSVYDTKKLNQLLDCNKSVNMKTAAARAACVYSFTQKGSSIVRPNGSFQGVDIASYSKIYVIGGTEGEIPKIAKMNAKGTYLKCVKVSNVGKHEIEGVQYKNGNIYFVIIPKTTSASKKNEQKICCIKESKFD